NQPALIDPGAIRMSTPIDRRRFLQTGAALGALAAGVSLSADRPQPPEPGQAPPERAVLPREDRVLPAYPEDRPRAILTRFGAGSPRQETIADPDRTSCPFIYHELYRTHGVLLRDVQIENSPRIVTSHGEGTLYLLTGKYDEFKDVHGRPLGNRFEP